MTEFITYQPCTWAELVNLGKSFQQKQRENLGGVAFASLGHRSGGFRGSLLREVEGWSCETPILKV